MAELESCVCIAVGFHRYILQGFTGENLDGINECEVEEFDPSSEVSSLTCIFYFHETDIAPDDYSFSDPSAGQGSDRGPISLHARSCRKIWNALSSKTYNSNRWSISKS